MGKKRRKWKEGVWKMPECRCPACGHLFNAAGDLPGEDNSRPEKGDVSFCLHCRAYLVFNADGTVHLMTEAELDDFKASQPLDFGKMELARDSARTTDLLRDAVREEAKKRFPGESDL